LATLRHQTSVQRGAKIFAQNCAVCHRIAGEGRLVGPQLDGIKSRGADRLIEDVLDPNRNVDPSFRYSTIQTTDGQSITGLFRRDEGAALVFVDATGREITVAKDKIKRRIDSASSLMPDNFSSAIPPE